MPECECGAHVSAKWKRLFAVDGVVHACPSCGNVDSIRPGRYVP